MVVNGQRSVQLATSVGFDIDEAAGRLSEMLCTCSCCNDLVPPPCLTCRARDYRRAHEEEYHRVVGCSSSGRLDREERWAELESGRRNI